MPANSAQNRVIDATTWLGSPPRRLSEMVADARRNPPRPCTLIRLVSHGSAGHMQMGEGLHYGTVGQLAGLRGLVRNDRQHATVEIHGCGVASSFLPAPVVTNIRGFNNDVVEQRVAYPQGQLQGGSGWGSEEQTLQSSTGIRFLLAVARLLGVGVKAGVNYQWSDANWQYEGPTVTVLHGLFGPVVRLEDSANQLGFGRVHEFSVPRNFQ